MSSSCSFKCFCFLLVFHFITRETRDRSSHLMFILSVKCTNSCQGKQIFHLNEKCKRSDAVSVLIYKTEKQRQAAAAVPSNGGWWRIKKPTYCTASYRGEEADNLAFEMRR